jgi:hypothetical protein
VAEVDLETQVLLGVPGSVLLAVRVDQLWPIVALAVVAEERERPLEPVEMVVLDI